MKIRRASYVVLCVTFFLVLPVAIHSQERKITIESALFTEYSPEKTSNDTSSASLAHEDDVGVGTPRDAGEDEWISFTGNVVISIQEGTSNSKIAADQILYNKTQDTLEARGSVMYEHSSSPSSTESFIGEYLLFKINEREGVFLDGKLVQKTKKKDSDPYSIESHLSARDASSTFAFKNAVLTTCDADVPHWTISASRIWLLPGNEIGILNGILRVGVLPVMYIPFFYYPSDEMIFNPVFGFRNREGYFVQTTTYLYGRKPLPGKSDAGLSSSLSSFLQGDTLKEQRREGLFFRNLETDAQDLSNDHAKLMLDAYSNLGLMAGLDSRFSFKSYLKSVSFSVYTGFSNVLYKEDSGIFYTPYNEQGQTEKQSGWFMSNELPFRFKTNLDLRVDKKPFSLTLSMPLVSDPFFDKDFLDRSEDLNWFSLLLDQDRLASGRDLAETTSFTWNLNGSFNPDLRVLQPWISNFSVSSISASTVFNSKTNVSLDSVRALYSSERKFFYPEIIKPSSKIILSGTLIDTENTEKNTKINEKKEQLDIQVDNPFEIQEHTQANSPTTSEDLETIDVFLPAISFDISEISKISDSFIAYSLKWNTQYTFLHEYRYNNQNWNIPEDILWTDFASVYTQTKGNTSLLSNFSLDKNLFVATTDLSLSTMHQDHPWLSEDYYSNQSKKDEISLADLKATKEIVSVSQKIALSPFNRSIFSPTSVSWTMQATLLETFFEETSFEDDYSWYTEYFKWDKDYVKQHFATLTAGVFITDFQQKVAVSSNFKPLLESYSFVGNFSWPFTKVDLKTRYYEKENAHKKMFWDDFNTTMNINFPLNILFVQQYDYSIEEEKSKLLKYTGSWNWLSGFFTFTDSYSYDLVEGSGWIVDDSDSHFQASYAGFSLTNSTDPQLLLFWKNRIYIQFNVNSIINLNILKPTESSLSFAPSLNLKIHEFLELKVSSHSRNDHIVKYYQNLLDLGITIPGETNMLIDLAKSFNFFNEKQRMESSFKLTQFNLDVIHYLHDWTMSFKTTIKPELNTVKRKYEFTPEFTFLVQWKPISDIKTRVTSEKGVFTLNTTADTTE